MPSLSSLCSVDKTMINECRAVAGKNIVKGNRNTRSTTFPCATLPTTNLKWPHLRLNPGRSGGKQVINGLRYGNYRKMY
jgi:hypothetical protein